VRLGFYLFTARLRAAGERGEGGKGGGGIFITSACRMDQLIL